MDEELRKVIEQIMNDLEKQKRFNNGVLKCIEDLRQRQERILEMLAGK